MTIEHKATTLELSDMNRESRTAIIAHAAYGNIDRFGDICCKGMFNKSWQEHKAGDIRFDIDHDPKMQPGTVLSTYEDEHKAYTKVKFGTHTLGTDTMLMMDEGIIRGASFSYVVEKKTFDNIKGRKIRKLHEVRHLASTVALATPPVNPEAGVIVVNKSEIGALTEFKAYIDRLELFCRNTTATDETINFLLAEAKAAREIISQYDTASTQPIIEPDASRNDNDSFRRQLLLLNMQLS